MAAPLPPATRLWGVLLARSALFLTAQLAFTAVLVTIGVNGAWRVGADWWMAWAALADIVCLVVLRQVLAREGLSLRDVYGLGRVRKLARTDRLWIAALFTLGIPVLLVPSAVLGNLLWGSNQVAAELNFRAIPVVAAAVLVVFPVLNALSEMPTYYGYVMPRLQVRYGWGYGALFITAGVLSLQHMFFPLLLNARFIVFKAAVFLPYALLLGLVLLRRPRTMPYVMVFHGLCDSALWVFALLVALDAAG